MKRKWTSGIIVSLFLLIGVLQGISQDRYIISRIKGEIRLDGISNEPGWEEIESLPVIMHVPNFGNPPSEQTDVRIAYDDNYLYIAARLYDSEPSKIQSSSKKRDFLGANADWFGILLDTFNDNENALGFFTTPEGLRLDLTVFGDAQGDFPVNTSWNTFWDVATVQNEDGWFAEMRIPFSSLRFQDRAGQVVMGLAVWRWIARKNEAVIFPAIPPKWGWWSPWKPSQAQEVVFKGIHSRRPLYVAPYILGGFGRTYELNDDETAYLRNDNLEREIGLDVKYGLASNLTLDVTLNTDFAQVEADDQQINLTRFSLFFPEKRLFFQERSSNFEFNLGGPNRLFYSRRIGIYDGTPVRIYGGARLVGRAGPWDLGFLTMQTAPVEDLPSENFGVLRVRRQIINPNTYVGGIVTSRIGKDGSYNIAYGLDGIFRFQGDDYLSLNWAQTFENDSVNNPASLDPARIRINWERRTIKGFGYNLSYSRAGKHYHPGIGFEMRDNYTRFGNRVLYGWIPGERSHLQRHKIYIDGFVVLNNADGSMESLEIGPGWQFSSKSGFFGTFRAKWYYDEPDTFSLSDEVEVPAGEYRYHGITGYLATPMGRLLSTELIFDVGSFYDGWRISFTISPRWSISSDLELQGTYQFNRVEFPDRHQQLSAHIGRVRTSVMFSTKMSVIAFVQYNSAVNKVIANLRFRYNPREGNDLYLVYNEGLNTSRYHEHPVPPFSESRTILLKYTYTFNL